MRAVSNAVSASVKDRLEKEVEKYNGFLAVRHGCEDFSSLGYWQDAVSPSRDARGNIVAPAQFPILSALNRVHLSGSTRCQSERELSHLALTYSNLRQIICPGRLEKMMLLKLNLHLIPEIKELDTSLGGIRCTQAEGKMKAVKLQAADSRKIVAVDCSL